jgi:hypothetical protein
MLLEGGDGGAGGDAGEDGAAATGVDRDGVDEQLEKAKKH